MSQARDKADKTTIKTLLRILVVLILLILLPLLLVGALMYASSPEKYKVLLVQLFEKSTGQTLTLDGPLNLNILPVPHMNFSKVTIHIHQENDLVNISAEKLDFKLSWQSLFTDTKKLQGILAENVVITATEKKGETREYVINRLSGEMINSYRHIQIPSFTLVYDNTTLEGKLDGFINDNNQLKVNGNILSKKWDIARFVEMLEEKSKFLLDDLLTTYRLEGIKGQIEFKVDHLLFQGTSIDNANIALTFDKNFQMTIKNDNEVIKVIKG